MKVPVWLAIGLVFPGIDAAAQTVIPDGLDCDNLTADQAAYEEYCESVRRRAQAPREAPGAGAQPGEDGFWQGGAAENRDGDGRVGGPAASAAASDFWAGADATATADLATGDFWTGAEEEGAVGESHEDGDAPWYNIKYECYASNAKGLEIRQLVKESGPDFLEIVVQLRFMDLHPKYHRNVLVARYSSFTTGDTDQWIALMGAGLKNGSGWTSPPIRIPRTWSFDKGPSPYTATWDDSRNRYRLSKWPDEKPYDKFLERELFGVSIECYQFDDIDPRWTKVWL